MQHQCERVLTSPAEQKLPAVFSSPFDLVPHKLAQIACHDLQQQLSLISRCEHDFFVSNGGKMFGVLVVQPRHPNPSDGIKHSNDKLTYLAAYSGMLGGQWLREGFAPPAFNLAERQQLMGSGEQKLQEIEKHIESILVVREHSGLEKKLNSLCNLQEQELLDARQLYRQKRQQRQALRLQPDADQNKLALQSQRDKSAYKSLAKAWDQRVNVVRGELEKYDRDLSALKKSRKHLSKELQRQIFSGYRLQSYSGHCKEVSTFFPNGLPPGGTGDCASIKLLQWCYSLNLKPVCLGEFWWGAPPPGGVRHHKQFYPSCRGKCRPILPHILSGLNVSPAGYETLPEFSIDEPKILFEDDAIMVLVKPAGMLSVAGKVGSDSVEHRLRARFPGLVPQMLSRMLVHRLDQATSGLMVAAKTAASHKVLHRQFESREICKEYVADIDASEVAASAIADEGLIDLPLRVDLEDRPRQMVCDKHGKPAVTRYRVLYRSRSHTRLQLTPVTGRTHQLRVHLAHPQGLNAPIIGDELYGYSATRLRLHAERLGFRHPVTGESLSFFAPVPF